MEKAGVVKERDYVAEDIATFQRALPKYQLIAFTDEYKKKPLFKGPYVSDNQIVGLRLKDYHFDHIKKIAPYLGRKSYSLKLP